MFPLPGNLIVSLEKSSAIDLNKATHIKLQSNAKKNPADQVQGKAKKYSAI
jgi:hypothetical protein